MSETPEGFLLCENVPIARIGKQDYLANELPIQSNDPHRVVTVYRDEKDIFSPLAMASFEGKPVTNEHPTEILTPTNIRGLNKGSAQNIRRHGDYLVADLMVYDADLIRLIKDGKREVSCGYNANYEEYNGKLYQTNIEGNHIAVVDSGRAGEKVAIKDTIPQAPKPRPKRRANMSKKVRGKGIAGALANLFPHFNQDAEPHEIAEIVEELVEAAKEEAHDERRHEEHKDERHEKQHEKHRDEIPEGYEPYHKLIYDVLISIDEKLDKIEVDLDELKSAEYFKKDKDPLEKLEEELMYDAGHEEEVLADPEHINEKRDNDYDLVETVITEDEAGVIMPKYGRPVNPLDRKKALDEINKMKPIIANIKDPKERKAMSDSMTKLIKTTHGIGGSSKGGYNAILQVKQHAAHTKDSRFSNKNVDYHELSRKIEADRKGKK